MINERQIMTLTEGEMYHISISYIFHLLLVIWSVADRKSNYNYDNLFKSKPIVSISILLDKILKESELLIQFNYLNVL